MNAPSLSTYDLTPAIDTLRRGELVVMPTETVYGLAADACSNEAVGRIYALKGRPSHNPLITHVSDCAMAKRYVVWNNLADQLADCFWPGPLTLVLPAAPDCAISPAARAGSQTVALRCPAHAAARALIEAFGGGLAAPSANRSGRISPTTPEHVKSEFGSETPLMMDGGASVLGIESTVLDCTNTQSVAILRHGSITQEQLVEAGFQIAPPTPPSLQAPLLSPGQLLSHYAPLLPVRLNATHAQPDEALLSFGHAQVEGIPATCLNLSQSGNLEEAAQHLFAYLRQLDLPLHRAIAVVPIPDIGVGKAINDRLRRAAAPRE